MKNLLLPSIGALIFGAFLFFFMNEWIIFRFPGQYAVIHESQKKQTKHKKITLHFWRMGQLHTETERVVWVDDTQENVKTVVMQWLHAMKEEQAVPNTVTLQSVLLSQHSDRAYVSFTASPLDTNAPTHTNILLIKGLLRTVHKNTPDIKKVMFLVNHTPLSDTHLDFSHAWNTIY